MDWACGAQERPSSKSAARRIENARTHIDFALWQCSRRAQCVPRASLACRLLRSALLMATRRPSTPPRSAADFLPERRSLKTLKSAAESCQGCDLYLTATQTVF